MKLANVKNTLITTSKWFAWYASLRIDLYFFNWKREREREREAHAKFMLTSFFWGGGGPRGKQIRNFIPLWATDTHRCLLVHDTLIHVKIMFYWSTNLARGWSPLPSRSQTVFAFVSSFVFLLGSFNGLKHDSILVIELNFFQLDSFGRWTPHLFSMVDMRHLKQSVPSVKVLEQPLQVCGKFYNVIYNVSDRWVSVSHLDIIFGFFLKGDRWSSAGSTFGCTNFESRLGNTLVMFWEQAMVEPGSTWQNGISPYGAWHISMWNMPY